MNILRTAARGFFKLNAISLAVGLCIFQSASADTSTSTPLLVLDNSVLAQLTSISGLLSGSVSNNTSTTNNLIAGYGTGMQSYITSHRTYLLSNTIGNGQAQSEWYPNNLLSQPIVKNPAAAVSDSMLGRTMGGASGALSGLNGQLDAKPAQQTLDQQALANMLTATKDVATNYATTMAGAIPSAPSNYFSPTIGSGGVFGAANQLPPADVSSFNMNSLLQPLVYSGNDQQTSAKNFIQLVSGMAQPLPVVDFSQLSSDDFNDAIKNNAGVQSYLVALRNYLAMQSVGLSNLFSLYAERLPINKLDPDSNSSNASMSPLQLDQQAATRRVTDATWYTTMDSAVPIQVQRETLYVLAEMRLEMFKSRLILEKMLATLSAMELQQAAVNRQGLSQAVDNLQESPPFKK